MSLWNWIILLLILFIVFYFVRKFFNGPACSESRDLTGKLVVITGASDGIGKETAFDLLEKGAEVVFACRNERKTIDVISQLPTSEQKARAVFLYLDLSIFHSIDGFVRLFKERYHDRKIDILINNAGLIKKDFSKTQNGIEHTLQTNLIGSIILTDLLLDKMEREGRIINVSSKIHFGATLDFNYLEKDMEFNRLSSDYSSQASYSLSKLGQIYFTKDYTEYCTLNGLTLKNASLHPGVVNSAFFEAFNSNVCFCIIYYIVYPFMWFFTKTPKMGAQTTLQLCYSNYNSIVDGGYYHDCSYRDSSELSNNREKRRRYLLYCAKLIELNYRGPAFKYLSYMKSHNISDSEDASPILQ